MYIIPIIGVIGEDFKLNDLLLHLNAAKNEGVIKLIFDSPGGYLDVAEEMVNALRKEKKLFYSTNSGDVASAAVELFLIPPKENRTFDVSKGNFLIHMPFIQPEESELGGTAEEIQLVVDEMKKSEKKLATEYSKATGTGANILEGFMRENTPLTKEQISQLGFATVIEPIEFRAVAYHKQSNITEMADNKETLEKISLLEKALQKITALLTPKVKALMIQDANGNELDFGAEVEDASQIAVGSKATVDGAPAEGEFTLADGQVLVFTAGELTEIKPAESDDVAALKQEIEDLKVENEKLKTESTDSVTAVAEATTQLQAVSDELKKLKALTSSGDEHSANSVSGDEGTQKRSAFKKKED